jgi:predicted short-subunit dehydrogenase-like oxidoreductase (DUF2520 family)
MPTFSKMRIVLIGAGRVAYHLAKRLYGTQAEIVQVYARSQKNALRVAEQSGCACTAIFDINKIITDADAYIVAISDDALTEIVPLLAAFLPKNARIVHTSGSVPSTVFAPYFSHFGVFYPLQSFSFQTEPNWQTLPICLHTANPDDYDFWYDFAALLSQNIYRADDEQRAVLHIAAVFTNNFSNYLYTIAATLLAKNDLDFDILKPLIVETALKVQNNPPALVQTGPAARNDTHTIEKHLAYLAKAAPEYSEIYKNMTDLIRAV